MCCKVFQMHWGKLQEKLLLINSILLIFVCLLHLNIQNIKAFLFVFCLLNVNVYNKVAKHTVILLICGSRNPTIQI